MIWKYDFFGHKISEQSDTQVTVTALGPLFFFIKYTFIYADNLKFVLPICFSLCLLSESDYLALAL